MFSASSVTVQARFGFVRALFATFCLFAASSDLNAAMLHIVYAVDQRAQGVGENLTASALNVAIFSNVPAGMSKSYVVPIERMSEPVILETLRNVPVGPDDTLMFVYIGHGAWKQDIGTFMTPSATVGQELTATQMVNEIHALRPRLGIVLFDCCNQERRSKPVALAPAAAVPLNLSPLFDELFFRSTGHVLLVSSSPGEYAFVRSNYTGGASPDEPPLGPLFMSALGRTLNEKRNERLNWSQVTGQTQIHLDRYLDFMKSQYPQGIITLNDGTQVNQQRQTIQLRFFR